MFNTAFPLTSELALRNTRTHSCVGPGKGAERW